MEDTSLIKSKYITIILHSLIWGAVLLLPFFFKAPTDQYGRIGGLVCNFFTITNIMHIGLFYFNAFYLYTKLLTSRRWWLYLSCMALLVIIFYGIKKIILLTWFPLLAAGKSAFQFTFFPTIFFLVLSTIYRLVLDKMTQEKDRTKREADQLEIELKFLRSQISPHFLFNVLNNLVSMARYKSDYLEPALLKLSGLMRYMLYESDEQKVSVSKEIEYLKSYIELQKLRFEEDVAIKTAIQYEGDPFSIEPMLLIPFVENAFKHGVSVVRDPFINIELTVLDNVLHFNVKNKFEEEGQSKDKDSGIGLANLRARLKLLYPGRHTLSIEKKADVFYVDLLLTLR